MFIYFLLSFIACIIGAISGIGGGIIIKPVLDGLGTYPLTTIGVLSSCTVLTMSVVSLWKNRKSGIKINYNISLYFALGGILGGILGKNLFDWVRMALDDPQTAGAIQAALLIVLTIWVLIYVRYRNRFPVYHISHPAICASIGAILGTLSSFLGIGGGPINIAFLAIIFAMDSKTAALNSIYIIFFSQMANLITIGISGGFSQYNLEALPFMIFGAVAGGIIGSQFLKKMSNTQVDRFFSMVLIVIIGINSYNLYNYL